MSGTIRVMLVAAVLATLGAASSGKAEVFDVSDPGGFQWALGVAAANGEHDTINVAAGYYNLTTTGINMLTYFPDSSENFALTIAGEGAATTTIANGSPNLLINLSAIVDTQANVTITGIAFLYGDSASANHGGGGLCVRTTSAEITVEDCGFGDNGAVANGGGAYLRSEVGLITVMNCSFYDNSAGYDGGGLWARSTSGMLTLTDCTVLLNAAGMFGGGVCAWSEHAPMYFTSNTIHNNSSGWDGGGVFAQSSYSTLSFNANTFTGNDAPSSMGGGLYAVSLNGTASLAGGWVNDNTAADAGGAYLKGDLVLVQRSTFENNIALGGGGFMGQGGGLYATTVTGHIDVKTNRFYANHADVMGGALYADTDFGGPITLASNVFHTNTAGGLGAGVRIVSTGETFIRLWNNVIAYNAVTAVAMADGGGVNITSGPDGTILLTNNTITGNSAFSSAGGAAGGGVRLFLNTPGAGAAYVFNNIMWGNVADGAADLWVQDGQAGAVPRFRPVVKIYNNDVGDYYVLHGDNLLTGSNINADPLLSANFHLEASSPCIDAGMNGAPELPPTDFENEPRVIDGDSDGTATADMGADEYFPFILTLPRIVVTNAADQLPPLHPMSGGTMGKGAMSFWFLEPGDQVPRYWGGRSFDEVIGAVEQALVEFQWPMGNMEPSNDATIFWRFEAALEVMHGGVTDEYPVYAFPPGTQAPDQPAGPPLVELKGHGGLIGEHPLFGFASPGELVGGVEFDVTYPAAVLVPVLVDIKPGSERNPVNVKSKGVLPVAVLGTEELDVTRIDPDTIRLGRAGIAEGVAPVRWRYEDVGSPFDGSPANHHDLDGDGRPDLLLKFRTRALIETLDLREVAGQTIPLVLTGNLKEEYSGTAVEGRDSAHILRMR